MKQINNLIQDIYKELDNEIEKIRYSHENNKINRANKLKQKKLREFLDLRIIDLSQRNIIEKYNIAMTLIKPKPLWNTKEKQTYIDDY